MCICDNIFNTSIQKKFFFKKSYQFYIKCANLKKILISFTYLAGLVLVAAHGIFDAVYGI